MDDVDAARAEKTGGTANRVSRLFRAVVGDNDGLVLSHRQLLYAVAGSWDGASGAHAEQRDGEAERRDDHRDNQGRLVPVEEALLGPD